MSERTVQRVGAKVVVRAIDNAACTLQALSVTSKLRLQLRPLRTDGRPFRGPSLKLDRKPWKAGGPRSLVVVTLRDRGPGSFQPRRRTLIVIAFHTNPRERRTSPVLLEVRLDAHSKTWDERRFATTRNDRRAPQGPDGRGDGGPRRSGPRVLLLGGLLASFSPVGGHALRHRALLRGRHRPALPGRLAPDLLSALAAATALDLEERRAAAGEAPETPRSRSTSVSALISARRGSISASRSR